MGGVATKLIERNTTIPTSRSQVFSTAADNQTSVEIHITQGERAMAGDNKSLGRFVLDGIPPAPRGLPQVEVTFDVDANGILAVKAKDKATNKEQSIRIEASSGLSDADIEKMRKDAEANADSDKTKVELASVRNEAEQTVYAARKALTDLSAQAGNKDKVPTELETVINEKITAVESKKTSENAADIKTALTELSTELSKVYEAVQKAGGEQKESPQQDAAGTEKTDTQTPPETETK